MFDTWYASFQDKDTLNLDEAEKAALRQKMWRAISDGETPISAVSSPVNRPEPPPARRNKPTYYRLAASVVGFLLLSLVGWWYYRHTHQTVLLATGNSEINEATLPDGSTVTLNANSTLRYRFDEDASAPRHVWLDGEAFFSVRPTPDHQPFVVHTAGLEVNVLGTKFNVRHRRHRTTVVLSEGQVKAHVPSSDEVVALRPGDQVQHVDGQVTLSQRRVDTRQYTAWRNRELVLNNTSLREIAAVLEDYYGQDVVLANDALGELRVSSTHPLSLQHPQVLLATLSEFFSLKATLTPKRIYLDPQ